MRVKDWSLIEIGDWLDDGNCINEVIGEIDSFHNWVAVREVLFNDVENDGWILSEEISYMTKYEVERSTWC